MWYNSKLDQGEKEFARRVGKGSSKTPEEVTDIYPEGEVVNEVWSTVVKRVGESSAGTLKG